MLPGTGGRSSAHWRLLLLLLGAHAAQALKQHGNKLRGDLHSFSKMHAVKEGAAPKPCVRTFCVLNRNEASGIEIYQKLGPRE